VPRQTFRDQPGNGCPRLLTSVPSAFYCGGVKGWRIPANITPPELQRQLTERCPRLSFWVTFTSGGRQYTFYWLRNGGAKRLAVKVHKRQPLPRLPAVEALATTLRSVWSCPECGKVFPRHGKQRYCTPAHAARARKRRWKSRQAAEARLVARRAYEADLRARHEVRRRAREARKPEPRIGDVTDSLNLDPKPDGRGGHYWGV
jgi:hypothetical protein